MLLKKIHNKATHGYLITMALQSRWDMLYVGPNTKNKNFFLKIYLPAVRQWTMDT